MNQPNETVDEESTKSNAEVVAETVLDYAVTSTEQVKINKSMSKTLPTLIFWILYLAGCIALKVVLKDSIHNLQYLAIIAGLATFTYMGLEYGDTFIKNAQLPSGRGKIANIERYKFLVYTWNILSIIVSGCYLIFKTENLPHMEIMGVAGILSVEYIAGNKLNRVATSLGDKVKEKQANSKDGGDPTKGA